MACRLTTYCYQDEFRFIAQMDHQARCLEKGKEYPIEYCLEKIREERMLWDMRWWVAYKDLDEIHEWLDTYQSKRGGIVKNCGHVCFCVGLLIHVHKVPRAAIIRAIMANPHVCYKDRKEQDGTVHEPDICGPFHWRDRQFAPLLSEEEEDRIREEDDGGIQTRDRTAVRDPGAGVRGKERAVANR